MSDQTTTDTRGRRSWTRLVREQSASVTDLVQAWCGRLFLHHAVHVVLQRFTRTGPSREVRQTRGTEVNYNSPADDLIWTHGLVSWRLLLKVTALTDVAGSTLCLKKVPTFELSVTLSNLNRFSKFAIKSTQHYPPHVRHFATLPWDIKNSNFLQIFSRYEKMQTNCIFSAPILILLRV